MIYYCSIQLWQQTIDKRRNERCTFFTPGLILSSEAGLLLGCKLCHQIRLVFLPLEIISLRVISIPLFYPAASSFCTKNDSDSYQFSLSPNHVIWNEPPAYCEPNSSKALSGSDFFAQLFRVANNVKGINWWLFYPLVKTNNHWYAYLTMYVFHKE